MTPSCALPALLRLIAAVQLAAGLHSGITGTSGLITAHPWGTELGKPAYPSAGRTSMRAGTGGYKLRGSVSGSTASVSRPRDLQ